MTRYAAPILALILGATRPVQAQTPRGDVQFTIPESVRQEHMIHVSPHLIVFDPATHTATVELSNIGSAPTYGVIVTQLGYTAWQNRDTALFTPNWEHERAHDTVIVNPTSRDHYLGDWLSGVPTHITLKPHETQRFTLKITPPNDLPDGEYYARIVSIVFPQNNKKGGGSQDTRMMYKLPVVGQGPPPLRDSVRVFFRKGPQTMGLKITQDEAAIDTSELAQAAGVGPNPLRMLLRVHLTGTTHFEGYLSVSYISDMGFVTQLTAINGSAFTIHRDGIMRWSGQTEGLEPGDYTAIIRFTERQDEFPPSRRIPMDPVEVRIPFAIQ